MIKRQSPSVDAYLQARMTSSRLPGKTLLPILAKPMLEHQLERVGRAQNIDRLIVVTSDQNSDDAIAQLCHSLGVLCCRGSENDVLGRFAKTREQFGKSDHIVRLTGDCPLADPILIDEVIDLHLKSNFDYTCNTNPPTFPDGLDVEVFKASVLDIMIKKAKLPSEHEHVTQYVYNHKDDFKFGNYMGNKDYSSLRLTVDEKEDFDLVNAIFEKLYPQNPKFNLQDVLELLKNDSRLIALNKHFGRNEGLVKSKEQDALFSKRKETI